MNSWRRSATSPWKKATFRPEARNNEQNLNNRLDWVKKWCTTDTDFSKNCVFVDESGFNINLKSSRAWAPKGKKAVVATPVTKAPSHSIIGAISAIGVVNISMRVPKAPPKIRKIQGGRKKKGCSWCCFKKRRTKRHYNWSLHKIYQRHLGYYGQMWWYERILSYCGQCTYTYVKSNRRDGQKKK